MAIAEAIGRQIARDECDGLIGPIIGDVKDGDEGGGV
ncbi:hypothetical protein ABID62_005233 [Bradyrhizobium sp. S3.9.1]